MAVKMTMVYEKFRRTMTPSIVDVEDSVAGRLRQVLDARDASTWNFEFRTSTPLVGRYDWRQLCSPAVAEAQVKHRADADPSAVRQDRLSSTPRLSSARRRLVFDEFDLLAADTAVTSFLLRRLVSRQRCSETPEQCSPEAREQRSELPSTTSTPPAVDSGQRNPKTVSGDADNSNIQPSSPTDRRSSPMAMKRTRSAYETPSLRVSKITGKPALYTGNRQKLRYKITRTTKYL